MNIALWIIQVILAAFFLTTGSIKLVLDKNKLEQVFDWIEEFSQQQLKIIGSLEIFGALGLFLPGVYSTLHIFIPLAAIGLSIISILVAFIHFRREERVELMVHIVLIIFLLIVIVGRFML